MCVLGLQRVPGAVLGLALLAPPAGVPAGRRAPALPSWPQTSPRTDWTSGRKNKKADGYGRIKMSVDAQFGQAATALLLKELRACTLALPLPRACSRFAFEGDEDFRSCTTSQANNLEHT